MLLTVDDMVALIRSSVNVQVPDVDGEGNVITTTDSAYLTMTDDDIKLFIKLGVSRAYPDVEDLADLPDGSEFAVVLLAKIELYLKLAVLQANKVDMGADNNNYLKQGQRFEHYMKLAEDGKAQYDDWLENESAGSNTVSSFDVLLSNRHYTKRNYEKQPTPKVKVYLDDVTSDSVNFHWKVTNTSHFGRFKVYFSTLPIFDIFADGSLYSNKIRESAQCVKSTGDIRDVYHRMTGLEADTPYYIAVVSIERNQVFGYSEISFTTLEEIADEEDVSTDTLNP